MAAKKRKRMGRPPVRDEERLGVKVTVSLTQSDWDELALSAAARGVTEAEIIRERIRAAAQSRPPSA